MIASPCRKCDRLVQYRNDIAAEKPLLNGFEGKPVPNFGDPNAWLLLCGLAPGRLGAATSRIPFVGDRAGHLLYDALNATGYCDTPKVRAYQPDIKLNEVLITNSCRCCPPENKLTAQELANCLPYLKETIASLPCLTDILCIGRVAFQQIFRALNTAMPKFIHGSCHSVNGLQIWATIHSSGYNQSTGRISLAKMITVLSEIRNKHQGKTPILG